MSERDPITPADEPSDDNTFTGGEHPHPVVDFGVADLKAGPFQRDPEHLVNTHVNGRPDILKFLEKGEHKAIAILHSHGTGALIITSAAIAAVGLATYEIKKHHKPSKTPTKNKK